MTTGAPSRHQPSAFQHGPQFVEGGVAYRLWRPGSQNVAVSIQSETASRQLAMLPEKDGWFSAVDELGHSGDLYEFLLDDKVKVPDVASRYQPEGVNGPSQVISSSGFSWNDREWKRPSVKDLIIYELHIGTFSSEGNFAGVSSKLESLRGLGVNAIELMPLGAFPGNRNWGYDVVLPYAPADCYGNPDDLRRLVDATHRLGIAVIVDVVYNHLCGEPNILGQTSPEYFHKDSTNAWGSSLNFDGQNSAAVRAFFIQNAIYWLEEFHVDGLRLDATHAIADKSPVHVLAEIAQAVQERGGFVIAEDDRNDARLLKPVSEGGLGLDAAWADDFHHVMKMTLKPEPIGHFASYQGGSGELADTLENGWLFRGQIFPQWKKARGTECRDRPPQQFVYCISNHDQVGNRPLGERLNHLISIESYRAASMFFLLSPYTPMLFMGQEWAASTPFVFFTNHTGEFGAGVSQGRLREFQNFGSHWPDETLAKMPDPEKEDAFTQSKLNWDERDSGEHHGVLELYRECLQLRKTDPVLQNRERRNWKVWSDANSIFLQYGLNTPASRLLITYLGEKDNLTVNAPGAGWKMRLSSDEQRFGGAGKISLNPADNSIYFFGAGTVLLARDL